MSINDNIVSGLKIDEDTFFFFRTAKQRKHDKNQQQNLQAHLMYLHRIVNDISLNVYKYYIKRVLIYEPLKSNLSNVDLLEKT